MVKKNANEKRKATEYIYEWYKNLIFNKKVAETKDIRKITKWQKAGKYLTKISYFAETSNKPSLRVVRRFVPLLLHRWNGGGEDAELEENRLYAVKLINANRCIEEKMTELDDKIAKTLINKIQFREVRNFLKDIHIEVEKKVTHDRSLSIGEEDGMKWNSFEIILFYLQTKPEYFARLMSKYGVNALSDLFRKCEMRLMIEKPNDDSALAIRKAISKFIEYSVLHFVYGIGKYWLNSLNYAITKINAISKWNFIKFIMQNPPVYSYNTEDEEWDRYGPYKPVLHITLRQLHVILQRFQNDLNEIIPKNSRLNGFITDTLLPDDNMEQYVTLHLHPFISDEIGNHDELFS
ncbi:unnamed protein product, partial [Acanthocheilonema viteae]